MRIDGKQIASEIFEELRKRVGELKKENIVPHLAIILVGNDPASEAYVRQKKLKGEEIGAKVTILNYESHRDLRSGIMNPTGTFGQELIKTIEQLNNDSNINGIIVQRPLPDHIDSKSINEAVDPIKDVDAFHSKTNFEMPLAKAVLYILEYIYSQKFEARSTNIETNSNDRKLNDQNISDFGFRISDFLRWLKSQMIVVMGKGETGGGPTIELLRKMGIEPKIIDSKTQNPDEITKQADIIICAVGKSGVLNPQAIKKAVILVAVGMYKGEDGKLHGDYEEKDVEGVAGFYTPVPGGTGPVNVAMLLKNLIEAAEKS